MLAVITAPADVRAILVCLEFDPEPPARAEAGSDLGAPDGGALFARRGFDGAQLYTVTGGSTGAGLGSPAPRRGSSDPARL